MISIPTSLCSNKDRMLYIRHISRRKKVKIKEKKSLENRNSPVAHYRMTWHHSQLHISFSLGYILLFFMLMAPKYQDPVDIFLPQNRKR
jgi:hypothetical protein